MERNSSKPQNYSHAIKIFIDQVKIYFVMCTTIAENALGLGTYLFVKVPRPGDSKGIFLVFESSCHLLLTV